MDRVSWRLNLALLLGLVVFFALMAACGGGGDSVGDDDAAADDDDDDNDDNDDDNDDDAVDIPDPASLFDGDGPSIKTPEQALTIELASGLMLDVAARQLLVSVDIDINEERLTNVLTMIYETDSQVVGTLPASRTMQIETPAGADLELLRDWFQGADGVRLAGFNLLVRPDSRTDANQRGWLRWLHNNVPPVPRALPKTAEIDPLPAVFIGDPWIDDIRARQGWAIGRGVSDVVVATVDTGFDLSKDFLVDERVERCTCMGNAIAEVDNDEHKDSHGTYTTTFALGNGGDEIRDAVGVCWECGVLSVDFTGDEEPNGFSSSLAAAIETAINRGANVINISVGALLSAAAPGTNDNFLETRQLFRESLTPHIDAARRAGVLVVMSAGNDGDGSDKNHQPGDPNHFDTVTVYNDDQLLPDDSLISENAWLTNALIVAATVAGEVLDIGVDAEDKLAPFSRRGTVINIAAPGVDVGIGNGRLRTGTSFAAPLVAGAAGVAWSLNEDLAACEVRQMLMDAANSAALAAATNLVGAGALELEGAAVTSRASVDIPVYDRMEVDLTTGENQTRDIQFEFEGAIGLDILFLIDTSASFTDDIDTLQSQANAIVDDLSGLADNIQFGVASFADFPIPPYGNPDTGDEAFVLDQPITDKIDLVYDAIDMLDQPLHEGADHPESQLEALVQAATGVGCDINDDGDFTDRAEVPPTNVGWRNGAVKVVILATDAPFHNFGGKAGYPGADLATALEALQEMGIIVIGLDSDDTDGHLLHVVEETGGLFFELSADSREIADAIYEGMYGITQIMDLSVRVINDPEGFIASITPDVHYAVETGDTINFTVNFSGVLDEPVAELMFRNIRLWVSGGGGILARVPVTVTVPEGS